MDADNRRWLAGLALLALVVGAFVGRWVFYPLLPDWSDTLVFGRKVVNGIGFWGGIGLMWSGERPEGLGAKLAAFVVAGLVGFGLMFGLRSVIGDQPKTNVDAKGRTRTPLTNESLKLAEMPGFDILVPTWGVKNDVQDPNAGAHVRSRAGRPKELVHVGWAAGEMMEESDFRTMIQPMIDALGKDVTSTARASWSSELEHTQIHQWRVGELGATFSLSSFKCPGDPRVMSVMTALGAEAVEAAAFTRRILQSAKCEAAFELEPAKLPHWEPAQEHTTSDDNGVRYYAFPGLGDVLTTVGLPAPITPEAFSKDEKVLTMVVQMFGFKIVARDSKRGVEMGAPPRRVWSLRVELTEPADPPTGEFEMLFAVLDCESNAHVIIFTPAENELPPQARELVSQPRCADALQP